MNALTITGTTALVPTNMDEAIRLAKAMASAKLVPKHLHDDVGSCLMIVEQSMRWGMSPFAVAQCTSNIGGKLMYEGKLIAAVCESMGAIEGHFDYRYSGEGDDRKVIVAARRRGETNDRELTIRLGDVKTSNEWWKKQPDQQLAYSGARNWARRYTPSALLGIYAPEEFDRRSGEIVAGDAPTIEGEAEPDAREALNAGIPLKAAAADMPRAPRVTEKQAAAQEGSVDPRWDNPPPKSTPRRTVGQLLEGVEIALKYATSRVEVDRILDTEDVLKLRHSLAADTPAIIRLNELRDAALERHLPLSDEAELPEMQIEGEENVAAG